MLRLRLLVRYMLAWRNYIVTIVAPLILSLFFLFDGTEYQKPARCTFVLAILLVYWTTECLPIAVTALLPMFLYPLLRITPAKDLAPKYMSEVTMTFLGSYIMVLGIERVNLHKRFALRILLTVGAQPRWLLFGIMMSACFLSMFINNAMSCALHLPIIKGIIDELREAAKQQSAEAEKKTDRRTQLCKAAGSVDAVFDIPMIEEATPALAPEIKDLSASQPPEIAKSILGVTGVLSAKSATAPHMEQENSAFLPSFGSGTVHSRASMISDRRPHTVGEQANDLLSSKVIDRIEKMLLTSATYSASIGGLCTLIGTPTNLLMKERAEKVFEAYNCTQPITFTSWLVFGIPVGYSFLFYTWFWLQLYYLRPRHVFYVWVVKPFRRCLLRQNASTAKDHEESVQDERIMTVMKQFYGQFQPMGYKEYAVLVHCLILIILLVTRHMTASVDGGVGWGMVAPKFTKESTAAVFVSSLLFVFPSSFRCSKSSGKIKAPKPLLTWQYVGKEFPFGIMLLLGGAMAAAAGAQDSGLPGIIAPVFRDLMKGMPLTLCVLLISLAVSILTEFMANVACVTLMSPIVENLAKEMNVNPLLFLFPTAFASSYAFMLPVAAPPNALVFSTNRLRVIDMVLCGIGMKFGVLIITLAATTWGNTYFSLYQPPCS